MTCETVRDALAAIRGGTLDAETADRVATHLDTCAECRADLEALEAIAPLAAGLPRALPPERDLWDGIQRRLRPRGVPGRITVPVWLLAAAAVILVAMSALVTRTLVDAGRTPTAVALPAGFAEAEARYVETVVELTALYDRARGALQPETRRVIERNLAVIERALREAREALDRQPANAALETLVHSAYRRKIEFLERATAIDRES
jgi:hypothetical protein